MIRNPKHLAFIRSHDCIIQQDGERCNGAPVHSHHLTIIKGERGMGQKAGDNWVIPICSLHHRTLHMIGEKSFWKLWGVDAEKVAQYLWNKFNNKGN